MANFQRNGRNVHGQTLAASVGRPFDIELWGPLDTRSSPATELTVTISPAAPHLSVTRGNMVGNARSWRISGFVAGDRLIVDARDIGGAVWSTVTIEAAIVQSSSSVVTRRELEDTRGAVQNKFPPAPAVQALIALLTRATGNVLHAGAGVLEAAGRSGNLYEHTAGLALDIYRLAANPIQQQQAHNLIRVFITVRRTMGWRNMFYESRGFSQTGPAGGSPDHFNHIHVDWLDFSRLVRDPSSPWDRSRWTQITYPPEALNSSAVDNEANESLMSEAWNNTSSTPLTDPEVVALYR